MFSSTVTTYRKKLSLVFALNRCLLGQMIELDNIDHRILTVLQKDGTLSQRDVASQVGLSQNACWRRIRRLTNLGVIEGYHAHLNTGAIGLDLTVFMIIRTRQHSEGWSQNFKIHVESIPQIVEMHRIGGDWDYLIKAVTKTMADYDKVYQLLTATV